MAPKKNTPTSSSPSKSPSEKVNDDDLNSVSSTSSVREVQAHESPRAVKKAPDPVDSKSFHQLPNDGLSWFFLFYLFIYVLDLHTKTIKLFQG